MPLDPQLEAMFANQPEWPPIRTVPVPALRLGILGATEGMVTSVVEVGMPPHQLLAVFQSALVTPSQVPAELIVTLVEVEKAGQPPLAAKL